MSTALACIGAPHFWCGCACTTTARSTFSHLAPPGPLPSAPEQSGTSPVASYPNSPAPSTRSSLRHNECLGPPAPTPQLAVCPTLSLRTGTTTTPPPRRCSRRTAAARGPTRQKSCRPSWLGPSSKATGSCWCPTRGHSGAGATALPAFPLCCSQPLRCLSQQSIALSTKTTLSRNALLTGTVTSLSFLQVPQRLL